MKYFFVIAFLSLALARAEVVVAPVSGKVLLESKKCEEIEGLVPQNWLKSCANKRSENWFSSGPCQYEVSSCVPAVVSELHSVKAQVNGLNGWNLALFIAGVQPVLRAAPAEEFHFFVNSPLCQLKKETASVGDILASRDSDGDELGASIFISERLSFTKVGSQTHDLYLVQVRDLAKEESQRVDTYHCESFEIYLSRVEGADLVLKTAHQQLSAIEKKLAHVLPVKVSITAAEEQEIQTKLQELIDLYRRLEPTPKATLNAKSKVKKVQARVELPAIADRTSEQALFLRAALRVRMLGIAEHLKANAKSVVSSELEVKKPLIDLIEGAFLKAPVPSEQPEEPKIEQK